MLSYCLKCRLITKSKNPKLAKNKNGRIMLLSSCVISSSKKSRLIKKQEVKGLLNMTDKIPFIW